MARPLRLQVPGGIYHVTARGNAKQPIYLDRVDRHVFLRILEGVLSRYGWRCLGYCLMGNHYHLLVETPQPNLSIGMRQVNSVYAQTFHRRHERGGGHIFQGRFGSVLVQRDAHFLELARYLALNPVRDGFCRRPADWRWSSHRAMLGLDPPRFVAVEALLSHFGSELAAARDRYRAFVNDSSEHGGPPAGVVHGTPEFQARHLPSTPPSPEVPRRQWQDPTRPTLTTLIETYERNEAIAKAYRDFGYSMKEIAQALGCHYATVSRRLRAWEAT